MQFSKQNLIATSGICFLFLIWSGISSGEDFYVPSKTHPTIQSAVDDARDGDVICIAGGTYYPEKTIDIGAKEITLRGSVDRKGNLNTIIDGQDEIRLFQCSAKQGKRRKEKGSVVLEYLVIQNGYANEGAGLYNNGRNLKLQEVHFKKNYAGSGGGGLSNRNSEHISLLDCLFEENESGNLENQGGAGVLNSECAYIEVKGCTFLENAIPFSNGAVGGGMFNDDCTLVLDDCTFDRNYGYGERFRGAGMANLNCTIDLTDCKFLYNAAPLKHAGIYHKDSTLNLSDCLFEGNHGAIASYLETDPEENGTGSSVSLADCQFLNNMTGTSGGAIVHYEGDLNLLRCEFNGNNATSEGGALHCIECGVRVEDCTFTENYTGKDAWIADRLGDARGGGVYARSLKTGLILNSVFDGNRSIGLSGAGLGGGLYVSDTSNLAIQQTDFYHNRAESYSSSGNGPIGKNEGGEGYGGGIYNEFSSPSLTLCTFVNNRAIGTVKFSGFGGGMYNIASEPSLMNCSFSENLARGSDPYGVQTGFGGGICNVQSAPLLTNCDLISNSALGVYAMGDGAGFGGGIYNQSSAAVLEACCIKANITTTEEDIYDRGGGLYNDRDSGETSLRNTVVCGNSPDQISGTYRDLGGNTISDECNVSDINCDGIVDGADLTILLGYWGTDEPIADLNNDGIVDGADLTILLGDWSS